MLIVGLLNLAAPAYGVEFLRGMGSLYPGFYHVRNFGDVILGTVYGFVDGLLGGLIFGWLYNALAQPRQPATAARIDRAA